MGSVWLNNTKNICLSSIQKHGFIDQDKYRKISSKIKWTDIEYHVQDNTYFSHKEVKMYCDTNQLPTLTFCGPHPKPHGASGLSKNYHLRFDPKLGHGICEIFRIPYACVTCTSMLDKPCISSIRSKKQSLYQPVTYCTYWTVLGSIKNWNIIHMSPKSTPFELFEEIHQVVIDGISDNMYCYWFQVEHTSTWNPNTPHTYGKERTETYPRIASGRQHVGHKITA